MSTGIPKTSFSTVLKEFGNHILEIRNGANGRTDDPPGAVRKTIVFKDMTKLSCQEFIKDGIIDAYQYDFYDSKGNVVIKFHSEPHDEKHLQTKTEPFHLHVRSGPSDYKASIRKENPYSKELVEHILPLIILSPQMAYAYANPNVGNYTPTPKPPKRTGKNNKKR